MNEEMDSEKVLDCYDRDYRVDSEITSDVWDTVAESASNNKRRERGLAGWHFPVRSSRLWVSAGGLNICRHTGAMEGSRYGQEAKKHDTYARGYQ